MGDQLKYHNLPRFLVVGAARCGTTFLHNLLLQHPGIFLPAKKEGKFFSQLKGLYVANAYDQKQDRKYISSLGDYINLFEDSFDHQTCGDISPDYFHVYERSIPNILSILGEKVKIIILLRDPSKRAYSHFMHHVNAGVALDSSFEEAYSREPDLPSSYSWYWRYTKASHYVLPVTSFLKNFKYVKIMIFEEFIKNPLQKVAELEGFLSVAAFHNYSLQVLSNSSAKQNKINFINKIFRVSNNSPETVTSKRTEFFRRYRQQFAADVLELEKITGLNLTIWGYN